MNNSNRDTSSVSPPLRQVKLELPRIPSPTPTCVTTVTTLLRPARSPSPAPSCSTTLLLPGRGRGQISIRPLSSIVDPDDQMSIVLGATLDFASESAQSVANEEANDWRSSRKYVIDRLKYIRENDNKYHDVIFEVEGSTSKQQFRAHKLMLRIASPVFDRIFETDNRSQSSIPTIILRDIEPDTFSLLLKYIYTDEIDADGLDGQELLPLLQGAKTYGLKPLYLECVKMLRACMSDGVAVRLCEIASYYGDQLLLEAALDHIANKAFQIFPSEDFLRLSTENLCKLFARNDLRIDEVTLFLAALKWGKHNCTKQGIDSTTTSNLRKVMQSFLPEIRFPLMRSDEFTLLVLPTKLLSAEEQLGIYQYISVDKTKRNKLPPISFKTNPRLSQKCLDPDSGSSSDYRENSSASPEQHQSLLSTANTDCLDTTTEAESETASNVSTYSENRGKSRNYERSYSHTSSSSSKKRRKIENELKRRRSMETKPVSIDDLFGNSDQKCIKLTNKTISLNNFILDLSRQENLHTDSKKLEGRKIYFPRLKQFELEIDIEESISSIISESNFELEKYIFFECRQDKMWLYEKLWNTGIDLTVIINRVIVLRLSHECHHAILNKFNGAPNVLKSLKEQSMKSLIYSHTHFTDKNFPLSLNRMVILDVVSSQCMSSFIQQFKQLKELTVVSPATMEGSLRALTLDAEFSSKDKIRKLGLGSFKLHLEPSIRFYNIVVLSLWRVNWESYFEEKFHHTFPKLQELYLIGPVKESSKLLKNIFRIGSMKSLINWQCDFRLNDADGSEMKKMLSNCGLAEPDRSFVLKKSEKNVWVGSKMAYKDYNHYMYKQFEYEFLYKDMQTFTNTS